MNRPLEAKWNEYRATLSEHLANDQLQEVRDAFYAGMIRAFAILQPIANLMQSVERECREFIAEVEAR